ncbi:1-aminocyclopropane-1-carboxylate deaminase [Hanstruepera neustonica]|uniref:1-aminocyclopropane-1-carboxylate deaminase n=1 Tax=Hanstruepera neustonica TaxID=1445657 RepID=A0A2K1E0L2_9FLAO|nr:pyridoxal-phosphate dependent enzyme [Hanstruepera neustonica]PNQ73818.1 1-aminocyclopropane-1-carboxylate deaminase [Hanstruepera neustonica]
MMKIIDQLNIKIDENLFLKPEYKTDTQISGNKYRKLKYNLLEAQANNCKTLLTFGGAYSNHIAAVAYAGKKYGFETIGVIRGEELMNKWHDNPTLFSAQKHGMKLKFVSRDVYRNKANNDFVETLKKEFGDFNLIAEGGTNNLAVKGCEEILTSVDSEFDFICCPVGTGGTISGLINSSKSHQKILGFPALKGDFLKQDIRKFAKKNNWDLINDYHFGGYAKINEELICFINSFKEKNDIPLDPIYTGKMMYGIFDLMKNGYFPENSKILAIHTGGLQGIEGMNKKLERNKMTLIL